MAHEASFEPHILIKSISLTYPNDPCPEAVCTQLIESTTIKWVGRVENGPTQIDIFNPF